MILYDAAHNATYFWEGGYSDDLLDPGGATNHGITRKVLSEWVGRKVSKQEVKDLSFDRGKTILLELYWLKVKARELPPALAIMVFDCAVNQGPSRAIKFLQKAHNKLSPSTRLKVDGVIGPITLGAVSGDVPHRLLRDYCVYRALHYSSLATLFKFGFGWFRRLFSVYRVAATYLPATPLQ